MKVKDPYKDTWENDRLKKQAECQHPFYVKKCSLCSLVLCTEKTEEIHNHKEILIAED